MSVDPADVRFGNPREWSAFAERLQRFLERFENLRRALDAAFIRSLKDAGALESMLFFTSRHAADDFMEILLVCGNGEAPAGQKLLRSFYERVVTIAYLHKNEEEFPKYFNYFHVTQKKVMDSERALYGDDRYPPEKVAEIEAEYFRVKDDYKTRECRCGRREMGPSWSKAPFHVMAKETGLDRYYHIAYTKPLLQAHASTKGTLARLEGEPGGPIGWGERVDRREADEVLTTAHALVLHLLEYQVQRFKVDGLEPLVEQAAQDWKEIWNP
jgi:hypothetical protein